MSTESTVRVSIAEAAEILGLPKQTLRVMLQRGKLPFGTAVQMSSVYTYYINRAQLEDYVKSRL